MSYSNFIDTLFGTGDSGVIDSFTLWLNRSDDSMFRQYPSDVSTYQQQIPTRTYTRSSIMSHAMAEMCTNYMYDNMLRIVSSIVQSTITQVSHVPVAEPDQMDVDSQSEFTHWNSGGVNLDEGLFGTLAHIFRVPDVMDMSLHDNTPREVPRKLVCVEQTWCDRGTCTICMDAITDTLVPTLSCDHLYHASCLNKWVRMNPSCPVCRTPIDTEPDIE
jgi:hypothetical protein